MVTAQRIDGVDISRWQTQSIDYAKAKAAGVRWIYHKATEGVTVKDPNYARRRAEAAKAGVPFGAYHFAHSSSDAKRSAEVFLATAQPKPGDMRPMLDFEEHGFHSWSVARRSAWVRTWVEIVEKATGVPPIIYNPAMDLSSAFGCALWVARYNDDNRAPKVPAPWSTWTIWQFTDGLHGTPKSVPGFGAVDANVMNGDPARITAALRLPTSKPTPKPKPRKKAQVRLASLNVLGASHTDAPSGSKFGRWLKSARRIPTIISIVRRNPMDAWAFQEMQPVQRRALMAVPAIRDRYDVHYSVDNVLLTDKLRWKRVETGFVTIPYFNGQPRKMPYAVLEGRKGGRQMAVRCTHDPAHPQNRKHRVTARERAAEWGLGMAKRARVDGVFDLGDMNDKQTYLDHVTRLGAVAAGRPSIWGIDWIVKWGSKGKWLGFRTATSARLKKATDHPLVIARAEI